MKIENLLPEIYYKESRDFSFVARLIELSLNYMKTAADNVEKNYNKNIDNYLLQLLADTLGFKARHNYNTKDLLYICMSLSDLYKKKGSRQAIVDVIQILLNSQQIEQKMNWGANISLKDKELIIQIPDELSDTVLIEDLFDYILPAGVTYAITRVGDYSGATNETRVLLGSDKVAAAKIEIGGIDVSSYIYEALPVAEKEKIPEAGQYLGTLDSTLVSAPGEEEKVNE